MFLDCMRKTGEQEQSVSFKWRQTSRKREKLDEKNFARTAKSNMIRIWRQAKDAFNARLKIVLKTCEIINNS